MIDHSTIAGYQYLDAKQNCAHSYLLPAIKTELKMLSSIGNVDNRLFDLGCGNGSVAAALATDEWTVSGVDPSSEGIAAGKEVYPHLHLEKGSAYDDLVRSMAVFLS